MKMQNYITINCQILINLACIFIAIQLLDIKYLTYKASQT